ncbi:inversin-like isoform X2 [Haliotis cracherodii]|uniref:inversin-like isoform X2 n=1 Tax=Haliotis cracherodii TaxID=6455 RepID=UPI0039ECABF8
MASTTEDGAFEAYFPDNKLTLYLAKKGGRVLRVTFHDTSSWCHETSWICTLIPDKYSPDINHHKFRQRLSALKEQFATHGRLTSIQFDRWMFVFGHETEDIADDMLCRYTSLKEIILKFIQEFDARVTDITMKSESMKVDAAAARKDQETAPGGTTDHDVPCKDKPEVDEDVSHSHPQKKEASSDPSLKPLVKGQDSDRRASSDRSRRRRYPRLSTASHVTPSRADREHLHYASLAGDLEEVKRLLSTPGVDVNSRGEWSMTPVMEAARRGHRDVVELLVSEGADVSLVDEDGDNILHLACMRGDVETVKYVLSLHVVDINSRGRGSRTPVMRAAYWGHRDVVELLVSEGADVSLVDVVGNNILHLACWGGDVETVKYVLSLHVVDIDARNKWGQTAADWARLWGRQPVVELLKSRGAQ